MITTIIFDMDGVIIDSEPIHQKLEFEMYDELGLEISPEEHKNYVGTSSVDMWNMIRENHGLSKTPEELLLYGRAKYWEALDQNRVPLVAGARELILMCHESGYIVQVASSATRPTVDKVIEHFQLQKYFSHRIGGNEVKKSKPDPEIFIKAARQSGSDPTKCLVIEDSANGILAAKEAGMLCIGYLNPGTGVQNLSKADLVVNDLFKINKDVIASIS
jgi:HAD superfamily hydrolase (TIGR01509 family)